MDKNEKKPQRKIKCPQCGLSSIYSTENPHRPFCSERCRIIDLGQWADGTYSIPVDPSSVSGELDIPEDDIDNFQ
jgi:endogenous inhibitor of DNA gyrase (YacG/DUF329 family)